MPIVLTVTSFLLVNKCLVNLLWIVSDRYFRVTQTWQKRAFHFLIQIHNGPPHDSNFGYSHAKRMIDVQNRCVLTYQQKTKTNQKKNQANKLKTSRFFAKPR